MRRRIDLGQPGERAIYWLLSAAQLTDINPDRGISGDSAKRCMEGLMEYASLMVYVDDNDVANARIELACDIAELFDAGLIGISGGIPDMPAIDPYTGGAMLGEVWTQEQQIATEEIKRAEARFRSVAGTRRSHMAWRGAMDYPADLVAREARAADLVIMGRDSLRPAPRHAADPGDVLMSAGRPVLVVPPELPEKQILSHVVVAWKDSREARRAVFDSLPLLCKAGQITVVGIVEGEDEAISRRSVDDVANFIRLHGANAASLTIAANDQPPGHQLLECARTKGAGLIVLGGYGHARVREWVFGGVTRSMLKTSPVCCLFSH
jgi:nucleotide-binding universal stress UspA family protein